MTAKTEKEPTGLELLRKPFPASAISKLPKPTKAQNDAVKADFRKGIRCEICGGWHHPDVIHLDYVGHAALTDRLLDCDPEWNWEPVVMDGLPNPGNGMWIKLTVCGVSRLGYGDADGKTGGNAIKEIIGDALRNAAMRFGAALDLWHKGDLHPDEDTHQESAPPTSPPPANDGKAQASKASSRDLYAELQKGLRACSSETELQAWGAGNKARIESMHPDFVKEIRKEYAAELAGHRNWNENEKEVVNG